MESTETTSSALWSVLGGDSLTARGAPVATATLLGLAATIAIVLHARLKREKIARPAGTLPFFYNTFQILQHEKRYFDWVADQCEVSLGRPWLLQIIGSPPMLVISTPELLEDVLSTHFENFTKGGFINESVRDLLGDGIFAVDGEQWAHQRKTVSSLFSQRALREHMTDVVQIRSQELAGFLDRYADARDAVDMFTLFNRFTFSVFTQIGFGVSMGSLDGADQPFQSAFDGSLRHLAQRFMLPMWWWKLLRILNLGSERELRACITVLDDTVTGIIARSLESRTAAPPVSAGLRKDIVALFLDSVSSPAAGEPALDAKYLRDVVLSFLIAGRDTTAQALSWFWYCLSQHPEVERKVRDELAAHVPGIAQSSSPPSAEQLHQLVYLEAALKETLRLHPSVPDNLKVCVKDTVLSDGTFVKAGTTIDFPSYALGRMTNLWGADALEFRPERWVDASTGKLVTVSAYKFAVFNAGPRTCLGMNLAMMEMKTVAATLLSRFCFKLVPGQTITYDLSLTLPIKGSMMMTVSHAAQGAS